MAADKPAVQETQALESTDPQKAESIYKEIISKPPSVTSDAAIKEYETALLRLGGLYRDAKLVLSTYAHTSGYASWWHCAC